MQMLQLIFVDSAERRLAPEDPPPHPGRGRGRTTALPSYTLAETAPLSDAQDSSRTLLKHERFPVSEQFG